MRQQYIGKRDSEFEEQLDASQVADRLGVHRNTVSKWIRTGALLSRREGNKVIIERDELLRFLKKIRMALAHPSKMTLEDIQRLADPLGKAMGISGDALLDHVEELEELHHITIEPDPLKLRHTIWVHDGLTPVCWEQVVLKNMFSGLVALRHCYHCGGRLPRTTRPARVWRPRHEIPTVLALIPPEKPIVGVWSYRCSKCQRDIVSLEPFSGDSHGEKRKSAGTDYDDELDYLNTLTKGMPEDEGARAILATRQFFAAELGVFALRAKQMGMKRLSDSLVLASFVEQARNDKLFVYRRGGTLGKGATKVDALMDLNRQLDIHKKRDQVYRLLSVDSESDGFSWEDVNSDPIQFVDRVVNSKSSPQDHLVIAMEIAFELGKEWEDSARILEGRLYDDLQKHGSVE